jgi:hypothetical protein
MFERYTEKARRIIFFGRYEASRFGSPYIGIFSIIRGGAQKAAKGPSLGILHEFTQYEKDFSGHSPGIRLR